MESVIPDYAEATGGTKIQVYGEGLSFYNGSRCRFGNSTPSAARFISTNHMECVTPSSPTGGDETCTGQALEIDLIGIVGPHEKRGCTEWASVCSWGGRWRDTACCQGGWGQAFA